MTTAILDLPDRIRRAEALLPSQAAGFASGLVDADTFRGQRVPQGLYEQRTPGTYMLRVRLPGGLVTIGQLAGIAELTARYGCERLHLTTRQDLQIHGLPLEASVAIQQGLPALGLSARGTGGNTVRNVTADPLAGVASDEAFDVRPWALATTALLLDRDGADALPRKFKVAFSGSDADRAGAAVADLGFIARSQGGQAGFQVLVGGGLGGRPALALTLESWAPASHAPWIADAIIGMFAQHGDRSNKAVARLRHVRHRLGTEPFLSLCREWIQRRLAQGGALPEPIALPTTPPATGSQLPPDLAGTDGIVTEPVSGRHCIRLAPRLGDLTVDDLNAIIGMAKAYADPVLRAGLDQELWFTGVDGASVPLLLACLAGRQLGQPGSQRSRIPACAGADTCKLGLLRSRGCATAIADRLEQNGLRLDGLRISGCPNSCGRHLVARIGLEGKARKVEGRLLPCFEVYLDGRHGSTGAALGTRAGTVPAKRIPELMAAIARGGDPRALVAEHARLPSVVPPDWFSDWGDSKPFSLAGLGEGECAAGA